LQEKQARLEYNTLVELLFGVKMIYFFYFLILIYRNNKLINLKNLQDSNATAVLNSSSLCSTIQICP
jgi:hypothetical protein